MNGIKRFNDNVKAYADAKQHANKKLVEGIEKVKAKRQEQTGKPYQKP